MQHCSALNVNKTKKMAQNKEWKNGRVKMLVASDKCLEQNVSQTEKRRRNNKWEEYCI
jgi:hypothetical protein